MLTSTPAPDAVHAKLFRAMAEIPGVEDAGTVADHTGKDALAVQWLPPTEGKQQDGYSMMERSQILIDPATHRFRGYQIIDLESGEPREAAVIVNTGIVNEPGQTP